MFICGPDAIADRAKELKNTAALQHHERIWGGRVIRQVPSGRHDDRAAGDN